VIAWDTERAAEKASAAMRYLADYYPEASGSEALHRHQGAAHAAAGLPGGNGDHDRGRAHLLEAQGEPPLRTASTVQNTPWRMKHLMDEGGE
jgi:hypothetical protein